MWRGAYFSLGFWAGARGRRYISCRARRRRSLNGQQLQRQRRRALRAKFGIETIYCVHTVSLRRTQRAVPKRNAQDRVADGGWYAWFWTRQALDARRTGSTLPNSYLDGRTTGSEVGLVAYRAGGRVDSEAGGSNSEIHDQGRARAVLMHLSGTNSIIQRRRSFYQGRAMASAEQHLGVNLNPGRDTDAILRCKFNHGWA